MKLSSQRTGLVVDQWWSLPKGVVRKRARVLQGQPAMVPVQIDNAQSHTDFANTANLVHWQNSREQGGKLTPFQSF